MEHTVVLQFVVILVLGTFFVGLCQRSGLSPIMGYFATGVLVGPSALGWLSDGFTIHLLAELGIVLLMFTIGLEFSLPRLLAARRLVIGLGGAQVFLTALLFGFVAWWLGCTPAEAFVLGSALAMSSTAIVIKQLAEQMELPTPHGRVITGILLFQDIAAVPLLVILPILTGDFAQLTESLALALGKAALVFVGLVFVGRQLLPSILHWVAATHSLELYMLTALSLALSAAGMSSLAGLPPTLGAFMAGMLLGETSFRHQIEADIRPFRDLMLGLFFATIGLQFNPAIFVTAPGVITLVLVILVIGKPMILAPLVRAFGQTLIDSWRAAIVLAHGGEFGLLVVSSALALDLLDKDLAQPVFGGIILSMLLTSQLLPFNGRLAALLAAKRLGAEHLNVEAYIAEESRDFDHHVVVCGYGRMGQNLMRILTEESIPALALDLDPVRVRKAVAMGEDVLFGNASQPDVLRAAGIERARALAITIDDTVLAERIISHAHGLGVDLSVLIRSTNCRDNQIFLQPGVEVFPESLEMDLVFAGRLLIMLDVPPSQVEARLNDIRAEDYVAIREFSPDTAESRQ